MPKNVAICVTGNWENGDGPRGMLTNITGQLPQEDREVVFGAINTANQIAESADGSHVW